MTSHTRPTIEEDSSLAEEAFDWVERLKEGPDLTDEEEAAFHAWLLTSPRHLAQFMEELALDEALDVVRRARERKGVKTDVEHWLAVARQVAAANASEVTWGRRPVLWGALAAGVVAIAFFAYLKWVPGQPQMPGTPYNTQDMAQVVVLEDSSTLSMAPRSSTRVLYSQELREIALTKGGAGFDVNRADSRPFKVDFMLGDAFAVGTQFNVSLSTESEAGAPPNALVDVNRGRVALVSNYTPPEHLVLNAGEEAHVTGDGKIVLTRTSEASRRTVFDNEPLARVADAFNQRNHLPRFVIEGGACGKRVSGTFDIDEPTMLINYVRGEHELVMSSSAQTVRVRSRDEEAGATPVSRPECRAIYGGVDIGSITKQALVPPNESVVPRP